MTRRHDCGSRDRQGAEDEPVQSPASTDRTTPVHISVAAPRRGSIAGIAFMVAGTILLGASPPAPWPTPAVVDLGAAASFAVLAGGGISATGPSIISGDVGTYPLPAIPDFLDAEATGRVNRGGARPQLAQRDLARASASVAMLPSDDIVSLAEDRTLGPGVYAIADAGPGFTGSLTLDGQGTPNPVWIFVVADDLVTIPGSTLALVNGAQACNVFWLVGGSATLAEGSTFAGSLLASTSVTVGRGVNVAGRLLARTGAVALGGASIAVPVCPLAAQPAAHAATVAGVTPSSIAPGVAAGSQSALPPLLPIVTLVLLVAAAILGEPHQRHRRRAPRDGW